MAAPEPPPHTRFALVVGDVAPEGAHSAAGAVVFRGGRLLHWGAVAEVGHGRALGVFDGVLFNAADVRQRLTARGLAVAGLDHARLALEWLAAFGPAAIGDLRWHGALALLHRAQGVVLLARDLVGVGWLGRLAWPGGAVWTSDPRWPAAEQVAAPPGWVGVWSTAGLQQPKVAYGPGNQLFLREIPDEARSATAVSALARAQALLHDAVAACGEDGFGIDARAVAPMVWHGTCGRGALWTPVGTRRWRSPGGAVCLRARDLRDDGPHEPVASADPADAAQRLWRWNTMPDGPLREARIAALDAGEALVAPHLDPALLAWLGALPREVRPAWLGIGDPAGETGTDGNGG
ncbi:MAG: hypothetical protein FJ100_17475 [Deltaproteobacteria bacterium]|nr:hypothetical protein [Deltaproteobacteria bacterium]